MTTPLFHYLQKLPHKLQRLFLFLIQKHHSHLTIRLNQQHHQQLYWQRHLLLHLLEPHHQC